MKRNRLVIESAIISWNVAYYQLGQGGQHNTQLASLQSVLLMAIGHCESAGCVLLLALSAADSCAI